MTELTFYVIIFLSICNILNLVWITSSINQWRKAKTQVQVHLLARRSEVQIERSDKRNVQNMTRKVKTKRSNFKLCSSGAAMMIYALRNERDSILGVMENEIHAWNVNLHPQIFGMHKVLYILLESNTRSLCQTTATSRLFVKFLLISS